MGEGWNHCETQVSAEAVDHCLMDMMWILDNELTAAAAAYTRLGDQQSIIKGRAQQALLLPGELLSVGDYWERGGHCIE